jgi:hypothetical protein
MPTNRMIHLYGGGTLVFNEYGLLKFHVGTGVGSARQTQRLESLWTRGFFTKASSASTQLAMAHRDRVLRPFRVPTKEGW